MAGRMRRGMVLSAVALLLAVAGCGVPAGERPTTTSPPIMGTLAPVPPGNVTVPAPDGDGPVAAIVWGTFGQFDTAPLMAIDGSGHTLAYGVWSGGIGDVSVCPGSEKIVVLGWRYAEPGKVVSVWDLARLEVEDVWPVDDRARSVRCIAGEGPAVVYLHPTGMDPSPPTSAGPTTTVPKPVGGPPGGPAAGSNTWSIIEVAPGETSPVFDAGEYGEVLAFTARWVVASHNTTLWIVDLDERPAHVTTFETTFPATAAIDPGGSFVVVAGQYPASSDPVELNLFRLGPEPALVTEATVDGVNTSAWARPFVWLDSDRFLRGAVVYDRDLRQVDTWPVTLRTLGVGRATAFGIETLDQWKDTLVLVDVDTGATTQAQTLIGSAQGIAVVDDGPPVTADAYRRVPEPTVPPPRAVTGETAPEIFTSVARLGAVDVSDLQQLRDLVAGLDAARVAAEMADRAGGQTIPVSMGEIDACSGVGFAAGAISSQALGKGEFADRTVIVYAFRTDADVTVAAVDPSNCEIRGVAGPLLTPGPGVNITTTTMSP